MQVQHATTIRENNAATSIVASTFPLESVFDFSQA